MSVATFLNYCLTFIISVSTIGIVKSLTDDDKNPENLAYLFFVTGTITLLGAIFMFIFMKETRGLSEEQRARIYCKSLRSNQVDE